MNGGVDQVEARIDGEVDAEELQGVVPESGVAAERGRRRLAVRIGVADDRVLDGDAGRHDLRRVAPLDHLGPEGVVGGEEDLLVVGRVEEGHALIVPGEDDIGHRRRGDGDGSDVAIIVVPGRRAGARECGEDEDEDGGHGQAAIGPAALLPDYDSLKSHNLQTPARAFPCPCLSGDGVIESVTMKRAVVLAAVLASI